MKKKIKKMVVPTRRGTSRLWAVVLLLLTTGGSLHGFPMQHGLVVWNQRDACCTNVLRVEPHGVGMRGSSSCGSSFCGDDEYDNYDEYENEPLWTQLLEYFQGDFDNYRQVLDDRKHGRLPREGGGHEHIHGTLVPVDRHTRLAGFYFDGAPHAIFRLRYYELQPRRIVSNNSNTTATTVTTDDFFLGVDTILHRLHPALEQELRQCRDPLEWPTLFRRARQHKTYEPLTTILPRCEVRWSTKRDPVQHDYARHRPGGLHAVMVHGEALVPSQFHHPDQQQFILIRDQLSLWENTLLIHDRGYHPETMEFVYGNRRLVPYEMERVSTIRCHDTLPLPPSSTTQPSTQPQDHRRRRRRLVRTVTNPDLQWTLGPDYRTPAEYEAFLAAMGGPSVPARSP